MSVSLGSFRLQPSTVHGIAALAATAIGFGVFWATKNVEGGVGAAGSSFGIVCLLISDNSNDPAAVQRLVGDLAVAATQKHLAQALPTLVSDAVVALTPPATSPVVVQVTPSPPAPPSNSVTTTVTTTPTAPPPHPLDATP